MDFLQTLTAVLLVLCLLGGAVVWLKSRGWAQLTGGNRHRQMELIERLPLSSQHALHLVRVGERVLLVASAPGGCEIARVGGAAVRRTEDQAV